MNEQSMVVLATVAVVLIAVALMVWVMRAKRRSDGLRRQFGPEYERTVETAGDRKRAEEELVARERHVRELDIRPLSAVERDHYRQTWREVQSEFVDRPQAACERADALIAEVMRLRGYPAADFEQRTSEISVDHPQVVETYRMAHALTMGNAHATSATENLRQAMVHYRELFEELVNETATPEQPRPRTRPAESADEGRRLRP
jgi:hypothetical protein